MKRIHFFALAADLLPIFQAVEAIAPLKYTPMGDARPGPDTGAVNRGAELPLLGQATTGTASTSASFLVCPETGFVNVERFQMSDGSERRLVYEATNPGAIEFSPGGLWQDNVLIHGRVATINETVEAKALMRRFQKALTRDFKTVRAFLVGPAALVAFDEGLRLTFSAQAPRDHDLRRL